MPTATYTPIATQTLGSAAASITFSSIPGTYTDLRLVLTCTTSSAGSVVYVKFNADSTTTNYSFVNLYGQGSSTGATAGVNSLIAINAFLGTSTSISQMYSADIFSYAGSTNKCVIGTCAEDQNGSGDVTITQGLWRSTAAITSVVLSLSAGNFSTGTIATLWGI